MNELTVYRDGQKFGRPRVYGPEVLKKTEYYFKYWKSLKHAIPSFAGLAKYLEVSRNTIYRWASEEGKDDFSYMLARISTEQEFVLLNQGIKSKFNSLIVKLLLSKHGYHDSSENVNYEMNGKAADKGITVNFLTHEDVEAQLIKESERVSSKELQELEEQDNYKEQL